MNGLRPAGAYALVVACIILIEVVVAIVVVVGIIV